MKILPVLILPAILMAACAQHQTPQNQAPKTDAPATASEGSLVACQAQARDDFLTAARAKGLAVQGEGSDAQVQARTSAEIETMQRLYQKQLAGMDACAAKYQG